MPGDMDDAETPGSSEEAVCPRRDSACFVCVSGESGGFEGDVRCDGSLKRRSTSPSYESLRCGDLADRLVRPLKLAEEHIKLLPVVRRCCELAVLARLAVLSYISNSISSRT